VAAPNAATTWQQDGQDDSGRNGGGGAGGDGGGGGGGGGQVAVGLGSALTVLGTVARVQSDEAELHGDDGESSSNFPMFVPSLSWQSKAKQGALSRGCLGKAAAVLPFRFPFLFCSVLFSSFLFCSVRMRYANSEAQPFRRFVSSFRRFVSSFRRFVVHFV
jgi:hypothetical protein